MDYKAIITNYFENGTLSEELTEIVTNDDVTSLEKIMTTILDMTTEDTISKKEALKFLKKVISNINAEKYWMKIIVINTITKLGTYKSISVITEFIIEKGPEKDSEDEKVQNYYRTKEEVLDVLVGMAHRKSKALAGLFKVTELGIEELQTKAIDQLKAIYTEKPKVELYEMIGKEVERQGETSKLAEMYKQLPEPTGTYGD